MIPGDPRPQNKNGQLFQEFLTRNSELTIVNSLPQCTGLITRRRLKDGVVEESILDFFVVCSLVLPYVSHMVIDERKEHVLTNFSAAKMHGKAIDTDHFTEYLDLDLEIKRQRRSREEILNFKNPESQIVFKKLTSETQQFTSCFKKKGQSIALSTEIWKKNIKSVCKKSFKKIRIRQQS